MILSFFGCVKRQTGDTTKDTEPTEKAILTEPTEEIVITLEQLLCATWVETFEVKDGEKYEVKSGSTMIFDQSGYVFDESGNNRGTWLLQSDILTMDLNTYSRPQSFQIVELTPEELCFAKAKETEPELYCSIFCCSERGDYDPTRYQFSKEELIGAWSDTGDPLDGNLIQFFSDGTGRMSYDGDYQQEFQWYLLQGNRISFLFSENRWIMAISSLEDGAMEMGGTEFIRIA